MTPPPYHVIRAFGQHGSPHAIAGGQESAWRVGNRVFKRLDVSMAEIQWQVQTLTTIRPHGMRLVVPLASAEGRYVVEGWLATPYVDATVSRGRWRDIIAVAHQLAAALAHLPWPAFLDGRRTAWDIADRMAWGDEPIAAFGRYPHVEALARLRQPLEATAQVIHGDLTGNVLFADGLAPAVIDFSTYWRPAAYATAIVVADGLVWEAAGDDLVASLAGGPDAAQFLVRALLFRALAETIRQPDLDPVAAALPFEHATRLTRNLVDAASHRGDLDT